MNILICNTDFLQMITFLIFSLLIFECNGYMVAVHFRTSDIVVLFVFWLYYHYALHLLHCSSIISAATHVDAKCIRHNKPRWFSQKSVCSCWQQSSVMLNFYPLQATFIWHCLFNLLKWWNRFHNQPGGVTEFCGQTAVGILMSHFHMPSLLWNNNCHLWKWPHMNPHIRGCICLKYIHSQRTPGSIVKQ